MMIPVSALSHRQVGPNRKKVFFLFWGEGKMMVLEPLWLSWWHVGIDEFIFVFVLFGCMRG